jgi:hypothetical protein
MKGEERSVARWKEPSVYKVQVKGDRDARITIAISFEGKPDSGIVKELFRWIKARPPER